jgi:hypothetical protein
LNSKKSERSKTKIGASAILFLIVASSIASLGALTLLRSNASTQNQGFNVINAFWGTSTSPVSAAPGDHGDTLTVTLQYIFSATAESLQGYLQLPSGFSLYNGSSVAYAATTGTFSTGSSITLSFLLSIASTLSLGSYVMPLDLSWTAAGYGYLLNDTVQVTVQVEGKPQLEFGASGSALTAGSVNQIPISISNNGSGSASNIFVSASSQVGGVLSTIPEIQNLSPSSARTEIVQVYVPSSAAGNALALSFSASYKDPYGNTETATQTIYTYVSLVSVPKLSISSAIETLGAGQENSIPLTITNNANLSLSQISIALTFSPSTVTLIGSPSIIQSLNSGSSTSETMNVYVPSTVANSAVSITFSSSFLEPDGSTVTASETLGFYTSGYSVSSYNTTVGVNPINTNVTTGQDSKVSFKVSDAGSYGISNPTITLSVSSPLVIISNSTFTYNGNVDPGSSLIFEPVLSSSPSATLGTYPGTLTVTYTDQEGTSHTQTFSAGFVLSGTITLTAESESVTQTARTLAVSGSLLNEGTASAYYASIVGCVVQTNSTVSITRTGNFSGTGPTTAVRTVTSFTRTFTGFPNGGFGGGGFSGAGATLTTCPASASSSYIGEVDPNSPVAFTTTVAYTPTNTSSGAVLVLVITYTNTYGIKSTQPIDKVITLSPGSSVSSIISPSGGSHTKAHEYVTIALYAVIVAIVAAAIAGGLHVRKRTRASSPTSEDKVV